MTKILNSGEVEEIFNRLVYVPSLNDELSAYERDEIYDYALRQYYARTYYWKHEYEGKNSFKNELDIYEWPLNVDEVLQNARIVLTLLEKRMDIPEDKKMFPTEQLDELKSKKPPKGEQIVYVLLYGMMCQKGKIKDLSTVSRSKFFKETIQKKLKPTASLQNFERVLTGNQRGNGHTIYPAIIKDESELPSSPFFNGDKHYVFDEKNFNDLKESYPNEFEWAEKLINELKLF